MDQKETKREPVKRTPSSTPNAAGKPTFSVRRYGQDQICFDRSGIRTPLTIEEAKALVKELTDLIATIS